MERDCESKKWVAVFLLILFMSLLAQCDLPAHGSGKFTPPYADNGTDGEKWYYTDTWPDSHEQFKDMGWLRGQTRS